MKRPYDDPITETEEVYTVTEITEAIRQNLESEFPDVHILGEIANFKPHTSGHLYFSLRDESNLIRAVVFRRRVDSLAVGPDDGMLVIASGRISHYGGTGQTQLIVRRMIPAGRGAMEREFRRLLQQLMREGLTAPERKRTIPPYPERIAVITSETGAVIRDILDTLARRWPVAEVVHLAVAVQGSDAVPTIVGAFERVNRMDGIDLVILARGGGGIEDLWAFNTEPVARAVAGSIHPVITGIGHEIDTTVVDYVADLRAATPTAAAELAAPFVEDVRHSIERLVGRLATVCRESADNRLRLVEYLLRSSVFPALRYRLDQAEFKLGDGVGRLGVWWVGARAAASGRIGAYVTSLRSGGIELLRDREGALATLRERLAAGHPARHIAGARESLARWGEVISIRAGSGVEGRRRGLSYSVRVLAGLHPRNVLKRGFTYCTKGNGGGVIGRVAGVEAGQDIAVHFYDGGARCRVTGKGKKRQWRER